MLRRLKVMHAFVPWIKSNWQIPLFIVFALVFVTWPELDLAITGLFWNETEGFVYRQNAFVLFMYKGFWVVTRVLIPLLLIALAASWYHQFARHHRKHTVFLLLVLLIGPGLIVHGLKDHWDRGRPRHVEEFGGSKTFSPPFLISDQCERNCSFPSGHAAQGFFFMALGWVFGRRWFWIGMLIGIAASTGRVLQGGHFFSDVVTSGFIVFFTCRVFAWKLFGSADLPKQ